MFDLDSLEFDHVFTVTEDGDVIDGPPGIYAPSLYDEELDSHEWRFWSAGYTGQYGYKGPIMHDSECFGQSGMARDLLSEPGTYALVVAYWSLDDDDPLDETIPEGWAVVQLVEH